MTSEDKKRVDSLQKNSAYEALLEQVNASVKDYRADRIQCDSPNRAVAFIVGVPRSGTTLLYQVLAETGVFGYCTNLMARFFDNPLFGLHIQRLFEPVLERSAMTWDSNFGRTEKWYEPHEFGYFWEKYFPFQKHHEPTDQQMENVDWKAFIGELGALESDFEKPLLFKNPILDFAVSEIASRVESSCFIELTRDSLGVGASLWRAREEFYGDETEWYSTRPRNWRALADRAPEYQIAAQIDAIQSELHSVREWISSDRWLTIDYSELCGDPHRQTRRVEQFIGCSDSSNTNSIPDKFPRSEPVDSSQRLERLEKALEAKGIEI